VVVDASVVVAAAQGSAPAVLALVEDVDLHAPELLLLEVAQGLRRAVRSGALDAGIAGERLAEVRQLGPVLHGHGLLLRRAWQLRDDLTAYDASYLALAELLELPLVTLDHGLAAVAARTVEVVVPA
jgi:predicted nucleic acid-binding protein